MSADSLLRLSNVTFAYGADDSVVSVLDDIDFSIDAGQRLALTGRSGSGKSTLMSILAGLLLPVRGAVF